MLMRFGKNKKKKSENTFLFVANRIYFETIKIKREQ